MNGQTVLTILGVVGTVFGICGTGAALWVVVRGSYGKATIDALKADIASWKDRVEERDLRIEHLEEEGTKKDATIGRLGRQLEDATRSIADLREMILQRSEFERIVKDTERHERAAASRAKQRQDEHRNMMIAVEDNAQQIKILTAVINAVVEKLEAANVEH